MYVHTNLVFLLLCVCLVEWKAVLCVCWFLVQQLQPILIIIISLIMAKRLYFDDYYQLILSINKNINVDNKLMIIIINGKWIIFIFILNSTYKSIAYFMRKTMKNKKKFTYFSQCPIKFIMSWSSKRFKIFIKNSCYRRVSILVWQWPLCVYWSIWW